MAVQNSRRLPKLFLMFGDPSTCESQVSPTPAPARLVTLASRSSYEILCFNRAVAQTLCNGQVKPGSTFPFDPGFQVIRRSHQLTSYKGIDAPILSFVLSLTSLLVHLTALLSYRQRSTRIILRAHFSLRQRHATTSCPSTILPSSLTDYCHPLRLEMSC